MMSFNETFFYNTHWISEKYVFILIDLKTIWMLWLNAVISSIKFWIPTLWQRSQVMDTLLSMSNIMKFPFEEASHSSFSSGHSLFLSPYFDVHDVFFSFLVLPSYTSPSNHLLQNPPVILDGNRSPLCYGGKTPFLLFIFKINLWFPTASRQRCWVLFCFSCFKTEMSGAGNKPNQNSTWI